MTPEEREQQWLRILSLPRQQRRAAARRLAWEAMSVPSEAERSLADTNRADRRAATQRFKTAVKPVHVKLSKAHQRRANKALRDRRRYARMSDRRKETLLAAEVAKRMLEEAHEDALD